MAIDSPAKIAVIGSGPIGLEAALYARFLGYEVDIFEAGSQVASSVRRWGHVRMFSPFGMNRSPLAVSALQAQGITNLPADDSLLTGNEYAEEFLDRLAHSDLLEDSLKLNSRVVAIGRDELLKGDMLGADRGDDEFRLLVDGPEGESISLADAVIDASGTYGQPQWLGAGGVPALGERALGQNALGQNALGQNALGQNDLGQNALGQNDLRGRIFRHLPDLLGAARSRFAGACTLLVGSGYSAATAAVGLAQLSEQAPGTEFVWAVRSQRAFPVPAIPQDRLPQRAKLVATANDIAQRGAVCDFRSGVFVHRLEQTDEKIRVTFSGPSIRQADQAETSHCIEVDQILALVGYRPDISLFRELQVHLCYASDGPMKLAAALLSQAAGQDGAVDCLDQTSCGPASLLNPEPHFYVLGAKSYGRNSHFLISLGLEQIRELFTIMGDRTDLNLYNTVNQDQL